MALIEIDDVHFTYSGRKAETLGGTFLSLHEGETVLLLGASGSGKSTLALCLNGLIPQTDLGTFRGTVTIAGYATDATPIATLSQQVGMVFQDPEAQSVMQTVEEEVAFGLENLCIPPEEMETRITSALSQMGLLESRHLPIERLSGGYKQRLALACALAMQPRILVLDEPTANLDPVGTRDVFAAIKTLKRAGKYTIVLIEHKLDDLMDCIDRVVVLAPGSQVLLEGDPHTIFTKHIDQLMEQGIWIPQVALLGHHLRAAGWQLEPLPITRQEAIESWKPAPVEKVSLTALSPSSFLQSVASTDSTQESEAAVEIRHLSYQAGRQKILDDISFSIPQGDFLALVGANGAGKTTLAYHLADILHPARGTVMLNGEDITRLSPQKLLQEVGYVFQNPEHQFVTASVEEELRFGLQRLHLPEAEVRQRVKRVMEQFGLDRYARAHPFTLSHGEKRRLSVATMLLCDQRLLVLDEPTFGQDQRNATALLNLLQMLNRAGHTILIITHDMSLVAEYTRHVAVLVQGRLRYHGPTSRLFAQTDLLEQAHLSLPPLVELAHQLALTYDLPDGATPTLDQWAAMIRASGEVHAL